MLSSSKLLQDEPTASTETTTTTTITTTITTNPSNGSNATSMVVDERNDDDPPPYSAIVPPNHVGWSYDFSGIPYSACTTSPCRATEGSLASFQTGLTSGSGFHPEGTDTTQHGSISVPLMPCRLFMFGSHRSQFAHQGLPISDNVFVSKDGHGRTRKYSAILVGAGVIIFLMALSLMVRLVMEKSFWQR